MFLYIFFLICIIYVWLSMLDPNLRGNKSSLVKVRHRKQMLRKMQAGDDTKMKDCAIKLYIVLTTPHSLIISQLL